LILWERAMPATMEEPAMFEFGPILRALWRNKAGAALVILQIALTLAIVSNAAFVISERKAKIARPTGVPEHEVFHMMLLPTTQQPSDYGRAQRDLEAIRALPGVKGATVVNQIPLSGGGSSSGFSYDPDKRDVRIPVNTFNADEHGLEALGLKLVAGRNFRPEEMQISTMVNLQDPKVVLVTRQLAEQMFGVGVNPLGKLIDRDAGPLEIVGVVETLLGSWVNWSKAGNAAILPAFLSDLPLRYAVRAEPAERARLMKEVPELLNRIDPQRVVLSVKGIDELKARSYREDTTMIRTLTVAMVLLALVTALGIVGLTLFWVNQRRKQIGTRRALGASRAAIVRYFLVENLLIAGIGIVLGGVLALLANQQMVQQLEMKVLAPGYLLGSVVALALLGQLAALAPAWRAAQVEPALATRSV
jgi:putative ABC transport system permease protein